MALGKSSNKTQKPASEPKTKAVVTGTKAKDSQVSTTASAGSVGDAAPLKTRKKSSSVVDVASALQNDVVTTTDLVKTMAAAAGSSALDASAIPAAEVPSNGTVHAASPDAIAELAYCYWAERGYAHGYADEDWSRAEAELSNRR